MIQPAPRHSPPGPARGTRSVRRGAIAASLALALLAVARPATAQDQVRPLEIDVDNVRAAVALIDSDLQTALAKERRRPLDQGFFDATLAYERGNLAVASVRLTDLVHNPEFQVSRDYGEALFMLGDCLFRMRNYAGAKRYLDQLVKQPGSKHFQLALQELADIAVRMRRLDDVEGYARKLDLVPPGQRKSELLYQFGRSFFSAGAFDRARSFLDQVPQGDKHWPHARFYVGAILVARGKVEDAVREFRDVAEAGKTADASRRPEPAVLDHANLALGRLYLQLKKYDDAVLHYSLVDRNASVYEEALFEMAATYVAAKKPQKALEALDVLLLTVSDDNVAVQAAVLRGRINMLAKMYDQADAAYTDVVERYSAITGELTRFASSDKNLEQFFTWLLNRGTEEYTVVRPVSERVAKYIEKDEDMQRVVSLFDDMAVERRDVKESARLAATIDAALKETSRLDMFPELKDGWMRVVENQNRAVDLGRRIVELLRAYATPHMTADERARGDAYREHRERLQAAWAKAPATRADMVERQTRVDTGFANLAADVGILKTNLESVKNQLLAVEKMLNDRVYGEAGLVLSKEREEEIRGQLQKEKDELRRTFRAIEGVSQDVEVYAQGVGAGDKVSSDESKVRAALMAAQRVEQSHYVTVLERVGEKANEITRLRMARNKVEEIGETMTGLLVRISGRARERIDKLSQVLAVEKRNIAEYQVTVRAYEDDSRTMARDVGFGLIRNAERRLADILLEADLGLVDVAWQRKMEKTSAIRELQDERSQRIRSLGEVLNNLTAEPGEGAE